MPRGDSRFVAAGHREVQPGEGNKIETSFRGSFSSSGASQFHDRLGPHRVAHAGDKCVGQVLAEQLLDQVERIGTPLAFALRDCGISALAMVGIAMEIGIEPTARHAADRGIIPVVIENACGAGHADAAQRSCEALRFAGDAIMTDTEALCAALGNGRA
jgi:nicotinamidase-related amidase